MGKQKKFFLKDGQELAAELVIVSAGIRSNLEFAVSSGIKIERGIVVNERMETSLKDVYACGDVAEFNGENNRTLASSYGARKSCRCEYLWRGKNIY